MQFQIVVYTSLACLSVRIGGVCLVLSEAEYQTIISLAPLLPTLHAATNTSTVVLDSAVVLTKPNSSLYP